MKVSNGNSEIFCSVMEIDLVFLQETKIEDWSPRLICQISRNKCVNSNAKAEMP